MTLLENKYQTLALEEPIPGLLLVRLNRPDAANAINTQVGADILSVFSLLAATPDACRCLILTGAGDKHFCADADLKERREMPDDQFRQQHRLLERAVL